MLCICYGLLACQRSSWNRATTSIKFPQSRYGVLRRKIMTRIHMSEVVLPTPPHAPPVTKCSTGNSSKSPPPKLRNRPKTKKGYITLRNEKLIQTPPTRVVAAQKEISPPMLIALKQRWKRITREALLYFVHSHSRLAVRAPYPRPSCCLQLSQRFRQTQTALHCL